MLTTYQTLFSQYQHWLTTHSPFSANTLNHYQRITENFLNYLTACKLRRLNDADESVIYEFAYFKADKTHYSSITRKVRLAALNLFFRWAYENGLSRANPVLTHRRTQLRHKPLRLEEVSADSPDFIKPLTPVLLNERQQRQIQRWPLSDDFTQARNHCLATLILNTGLFVEEVLLLTLDDIDIHKMTIRIQGEQERRRTVTLTAPYSQRALKNWLKSRDEALVNYMDVSWLFFSRRFYPFTRRTLSNNVALYFDELGIQTRQRGPEVLRQTAIINLIKQHPIDVVKTLTGLKSIKHLEKYQAIVSQQHKD